MSVAATIVAAAASAVGAGNPNVPWADQVRSRALEIAALASETGELSGAIDAVLGGEGSKSFLGVIMGVGKEQRSNRVVVTLKTGTNRIIAGLPPGHESARTDRLDGDLGLAVARTARELIGHNVRVYLKVEIMENPKNPDHNKVRVLKHVQDLGPSTDPEAVTARQAYLQSLASAAPR